MIDPIWHRDHLREGDGVIVGCNEAQEWLLLWWWENYKKWNRYPVSFVDFGMSERAKNWCVERGELIPLSRYDLFVLDADEIDPELVSQWEKRFGYLWDRRRAWFKKPSACLKSPYRRTIWIDLDCEVVKSLDPLFQLSSETGFAIARDPIVDGYNSGVIGFERGCPLIQKWAKAAQSQNGKFPGDQDLLTHLIETGEEQIYTLPEIYNWSFSNEIDENVVIRHWLTNIAKSLLKNQIHAMNFFKLSE